VSGEPVRVERDAAGLAVVTFDSPPLNLFGAELGDGLERAVAELGAEPPRAVLFRAEGRVFTGGVDVNVFAGLEGPAQATAMFAELMATSRAVEALPCPTILAAHSLTLTWAFELALACDLILAAESASFGLVESRVGLTPAMGGPQRIAERAGTGRARELVMTGDLYSAETLERWGVVNRVLPDEGFDEAVRGFAAALAAGPTRAHAATKEILAAYLRGGVGEANDATPAIAGGLWDTEDLRAGVRAFLETGPGSARFKGC